MGDVLGPVVAGSFYSADPDRLRSTVRRYLDAAAAVAGERADPVLIVPHAGHVYSGSVAATAYARLRGTTPSRVVVIGPSHFTWFPGLAVPAAAWWATPLGRIPIDVRAAVDEEVVGVREQPFLREHCLEVQLPFLQEVLDSFVVVPLLTGDVHPVVVADVLDAILDDTSILIVSSDLSHYLDHATAQARDRATAEAIVSRRVTEIGPDGACGHTGIQAALYLAERRSWTVELLDLRSSGDTTGPHDRVVGYGAFAIG